MVKCIQRICRGSPVDKNTLAESEIMNRLFDRHYLKSEHTLNYFRDELMSVKSADRQVWQKWFQSGTRDMTVRARKRVHEILSSARPCPGIPEERQKAVDEFAEEMCKKHRVDHEPLRD